MKFKFQQTSDLTRLIIIAQFFLLSYLLFNLTFSLYRNYQFNRSSIAFEAENLRLIDANKNLAEQIDYVSSDSYYEKVIKQNEGLVLPGEEVIIVPKVKDADLLEENSLATDQKTSANHLIWWNAFFGTKSN
jgi:cell division protein FtsB